MKTWPVAATLALLAGGLLAFAPASSSTAPAASTPAASALADDGAIYRTLVKDKGDAIVAIKYTLKQGDDESEEEVQGVVIEESGLILTSNYLVGGFPEAVKQMAGGNRKPQEIKVMIGGDQEGIPATLVARDSELDVAWVQITNPDKKKFAFVDIAKPAEGQLGDRILTVERLSKTNDHAHIINESRIRSMITKPRKLLVPGGEFGNSLGMPVFNDKGEFLGVMCLQLPNAEEMAAERNSHSQFAALRQISRVMLMPGDEIVKATAAAKEQAKSGKPVDDEPAAAPADPAAPAGPAPAPTTTPAPAEPKPDAPK